jgi:hypothetical protein
MSLESAGPGFDRGSMLADSDRHSRPLLSLWPLLVIAAVLIAVRWGTFDARPTWDPAMSIWPAGIEIAARNSISDVLDLPSYAMGGPNTHTLSVVTLLGAALIEIGGLDFAIVAMHVLNGVMLLALGYLVARTVWEFSSNVAGWLTGAAVVLFPLMVAQSAYLYTELPAAFLVFAALVLSSRRRPLWSALALTVAVLIKPLGVVAIPALAVLTWRKRGTRREIAAPALALLGLIPALLVPQPPPQGSTLLASLLLVWRTSWAWALETPEFLLLVAVPVLAYLVVSRRDTSREEWDWFWAASTLIASFVAFFALNAVVTQGWFFIPRYFAMLVAPTMVLVALTISRMRLGAQLGVLGGIVLVSLIGVRGPLAWGAGSSLPPTTERSLAFIDLFEEHRSGLDRLAILSSESLPTFHDHYASFSLAYPELGHFRGDIENTTTVRSGNWGSELDELPDRFAMLVELPFLGGERMLRVKRLAESDDRYRVTIEPIGTAVRLPIQIVLVERVDGG